MAQQPKVTVRNQGCGAGCAATIAVLFVVSLIVAYWYVAVAVVAVAVIGLGTYWWFKRRPSLREATVVPVPIEPVVETPRCPECGVHVAGDARRCWSCQSEW